MERWKRNALRDSAKSLIPMQRQLRALKRRLGEIEIEPKNNIFCLQQGLDQIEYLRSAGANLGGSILEFGSGWFPIIPMLFHLAQARRVILTDVEQLMDDKTITIARNVILENERVVAERLGLSTYELHSRLASFAPEYLVPWKSTLTSDKSVDVIVSRAVIEHVPIETIRYFFAEFKRILKDDGFTSHIIDNSDHLEHSDKSLSRINFLRFEDRDLWWRIACMNIQGYQNRLRHSDYSAFFEENGWRILTAEGSPDAKAVVDASKLPLSSRFRGRDPHDLAILTSHFILTKAEHLPIASASTRVS